MPQTAKVIYLYARARAGGGWGVRGEGGTIVALGAKIADLRTSRGGVGRWQSRTFGGMAGQKCPEALQNRF